MRKLQHLGLTLCLGLLFASCQSDSSGFGTSKDPVDLVNPYMGNISHLLMPTFPTVQLPNSMMRVTPHRSDYTSETISGLPIILTSHRGTSAFALSPLSSYPDSLPSVLSYIYDREQTTPYRYSVYLPEQEIAVQYAPSHQSAIYQLSYEQKNTARGIMLSTPNGTLTAKDKSIYGYEQLNDSVRVYLYLESNEQPEALALRDSTTGRLVAQADSTSGSTVALLYPQGTETAKLRYGISYISVEQAKRNVEREIQTYELDMVAKAGRSKWEQVLSKIEVEGGSEEERRIFYTSLYRTYERMINISEDGQYYSAELKQTVSDKGIPYYTDDWVWDTYLATHPLRILIEPEMQQHILQSYLRQAEATPEQWLATFPEVTGDSHRMNGNHAIAIFADAFTKGLTGFDLNKAYLYASKTLTERSLLPWTRMPKRELTEHFHEKGYFPALNQGETEPYSYVTKWEKRQAVAVSLATYYDYWALSELAKHLGKDEEADKYLRLSYGYHKLYNHQTGFFHPRNAEGNFVQPFDYERSGGLGARDYYDENNAYTYRWDVKHNIADLIYLMGGKENFIRNLDETFRTPLSCSKWEFYSQMPDQTGNVGQFTMGNEPSMHIPYLYVYASAPWRTQRLIHKLRRSWFRDDLMGLPGDEDGGGLSAFVVFSMMGFYPVTPGQAIYVIGSPAFPKTTMRLPSNKTFVVEADGLSDENIYIQSAKLNGRELGRAWLKHSEIVSGGELVLEMGNKPNKAWGANEAPPSAKKLDIKLDQ
ncbi:MAG: GH92 family glycosyl hydrolase [Porphyromonas sp.]|nr:GH92 family glycosyl hydrolase [Porphyromonas sp.]